MSLRDEILRDSEPDVVQPRGYTLLVPPDWGRFESTDAGRDELTSLLKSRFQQVGRPDLYAQARSAVQRQWQRIQQQGAIEFYMPVKPTIEGATPMSVLTAPWITRGASFADDVAERSQTGTGVETLDSGDGSVVYRWEDEQRGEGDIAGVVTREITYVRPFPGSNPTRGIMVLAAIIHPGEKEAGPALDGFTALADAIMATFVWRFA